MPARVPVVRAGFTLIEVMIVVGILGILATMALPSYQDRIIRSQVAEGVELAEFARRAVAEHLGRHRTLPRDNAAAGLPPADRIVGNYVSGIAVRDGAITISFGQLSNKFLAGKQLSLRPALVEGYPQVPIAWVCGRAAVPDRMKVQGTDQTTLPGPHLPIDCRAGPSS